MLLGDTAMRHSYQVGASGSGVGQCNLWLGHKSRMGRVAGGNSHSYHPPMPSRLVGVWASN